MKGLFLLSLLLALTVPSVASESPLPEPVRERTSQSLSRCSTGVIEVWGFIDVGRASVWMPDCSRLEWPLEPPLLLRFGYDRKVPGKAFAKSSLAMLERNMGKSTFRAMEERFRAFNANYRDTSEGDVYTMLYETDGSLTLWLNDRHLAGEQGHDFARQYLKIWFGPRPFSDKLKDALLSPGT